MTATTAAMNDIKRFANQFRGLLALADELQNVASVEQATAEAQAKLDAVTASLAKRTNDHNELDAIISQHIQKADDDCAKRRADADAYHFGKVAEADGLKAKAKLDIEDAQTRAETVLSGVKQQIEAAQHVLDAIEGKATDKQAELADLHSQTEAAKAELNRVAAAHADFLASIAGKPPTL